MKRLLSWLLVLVMVVGLLPMSAFAATDVDNDWETPPDIIVDFGGELNPITVEWTWNDGYTEGTASATVPAGKTYHYIYYGDPAYELSVDGVAHEFTPAAGRTDPNAFTITNDTDAEKTYALKLALPVGTYNNPKIIEEMSWYYGSVDQVAGDNEGYYYTWTAPAAGTVTFYFTELPGTEDVYDENGEIVTEAQKYVGDIRVTVNYEQVSLLNEGVDNNGLELVVDVEPGDVLLINTAVVEDLEQNAYPEASYTWCGNFAYPAGSEQNPIVVEWTWNENETVATATIVVEADGTYYYGISGMILTVDGVEAEMGETFMLNAGTHEVVLSTPAGAWNNPAELVIGENTATVAAGSWGGYLYTWTAEEAGTLSLTMPSDKGWFYVINNTTTGVYGDGQWSDGDPVVNPGTIEVAAGDVLSIEVNTYDPADPYNNPGGSVTFTAAFEAAVVAPEYVVEVSGITLDMAAELFIAAKFQIPAELQADANATLTLEFKGDVTEYNLVELIAENGLDNRNRLTIKQPIPSPYMDKKITITIMDGNGYAADFSLQGNVYDGAYSFGIEDYADLIYNVASMKNVMDAIAALLTYGSVAQEMFSNLPNVSTEPASNLLSKYGYKPVDLSKFDIADATVDLVHSGADFGVSMRGGTPALDAAVYMTVQFDYDKAVALENLSFVVKYHEAASNKDFEIPVEATLNNKGRIEVKIENIAAALFDCVYTVEVTNTLTGEVYSGQASVFEYIRATVAALDGNASQATTVNMAKAMYFYNQAANALFE